MQEIKTMMWVGGCHNDWKRNGKDGGHIATHTDNDAEGKRRWSTRRSIAIDGYMAEQYSVNNVE